MPVATAWSVAVVGVSGRVVEVEADLAGGLPGLSLIGLPDTSLSEARDRVRAAIVNSGLTWPQRRITVALSPAMLPKSGSLFDLAVAGAVLAADGQVPERELADRVLLGELGLDGRVRPVRGILPAVLAASQAGRDRVVVPAGNATEAALVPGVTVEPVLSLTGLVGLLRGTRPPALPVDPDHAEPVHAPGPDLADVAGQLLGRRAVEVAAAGGHHLLLVGPPGAGKTMLAERLPGLLPDLDDAAALEVTAVHSVAGLLSAGRPLVRRPPLRAPHHTASVAAMVGGGSAVLRPGLASQAHHGVLFLDEAPEFASGVLDALRQPLESGVIEVARSRGSAAFPARFTLVLAANPCPCAAAGGAANDCSCPPGLRRRYQARLSGPLLDRVDLRVGLYAATRAELLADQGMTEGSAEVAARVASARDRARARWAGTPWTRNADVPGPHLRAQWPSGRATLRPLERAFDRGQLSARGLDRALRVSWTLADLAGAPAPGVGHVGEALALRLSDLALGSAA